MQQGGMQQSGMQEEAIELKVLALRSRGLHLQWLGKLLPCGYILRKGKRYVKKWTPMLLFNTCDHYFL